MQLRTLRTARHGERHGYMNCKGCNCNCKGLTFSAEKGTLSLFHWWHNHLPTTCPPQFNMRQEPTTQQSRHRGTPLRGSGTASDTCQLQSPRNHRRRHHDQRPLAGAGGHDPAGRGRRLAAGAGQPAPRRAPLGRGKQQRQLGRGQRQRGAKPAGAAVRSRTREKKHASA